MELRYPIKNIFPVSKNKFGEIKYCNSLRLPSFLNQTQIDWVLIYEELNRRLFPEYKAWFDEIIPDNNGNLILNAIEDFIGREIIEFMRNPDENDLRLLFNKMRYYRGSPDVIAITVARNLGLSAKRIVDSEEAYFFWMKKFNDLSREFKMPTRSSRKAMSQENKAFYILVESNHGGYLIFGQAAQTTPAVVRDLLGDKFSTSQLLKQMGFSVPHSKLIKSESDLSDIPYKEFIFKPINDSNRVGVVGPISNDDIELIKLSYNRSVSQVSNGSSIIIAEQFIHGDAYRINVNHGKVTFVAKSVRCSVVGDGKSTIKELLNRRRKELNYNFYVADDYFLNKLVCRGLTLEFIVPNGQVIVLSHDGNEEGYFIDVTDEFDLNIKEDAIRLSHALQCPVIGLDVIIDKHGTHWYVDVNTNPGIDFFGSTRRAYETMEHMLNELIGMPNKALQLTANPPRSLAAAELSR